MKPAAPKPAAARRSVTICIPPREGDPEGEALFFRAEVAGRTVVATTRIARPSSKPARAR